MNKFLFLNTGWMDFYDGLKNDEISGGGKFVSKEGYGHELFNFRNHNGTVFGFVQPLINRRTGGASIISIERLGADKEDMKIDSITVVWLASNPISKGTYIVGWYPNATVYRSLQFTSSKNNRQYKGERIGYYIKAKYKDATLLPLDERVFQIHRRKKNWLGQSNVWFADHNPGLIQQVDDYINKGTIPPPGKPKPGRKKPNPYLRREVELKAIEVVVKHYQSLGYVVDSVEIEKVGWDLNATRDRIELKLEVKGISGKSLNCELTPNEYQNLLLHRENYRICIVSEALTNPMLKVFYHSKEFMEWISSEGTKIHLEDAVSARISELFS